MEEWRAGRVNEEGSVLTFAINLGTENKHQVSLEPSRTPGMFFHIKPREGGRNREKWDWEESEKEREIRLRKGV